MGLQALVLLLFNDADELSYGAIKGQLGVTGRQGAASEHCSVYQSARWGRCSCSMGYGCMSCLRTTKPILHVGRHRAGMSMASL